MKSKIFIFTTLILVVFLFVITSCDNFLNAKNKTTININLDLSKILKTSRNETTSNPTEYILKVFAYNAASYKPEDEIENLPLLTQTENKVDINGNVKARLDVEIGLNVIFVAKLYQIEAEKPLYAGKSEVIKIKATNNKVLLVLTRENADLDIDILIHDHTFATEWSSDGAYHWKWSTCEHEVVSEKAEHSFGEYVSNNDATTEADGTITRKCSVCGYEDTVTDEGSKIHVHTFATDWIKNATHHWHAATCEHTTEVSEKATHTFGEYVSNNDATTDADGTKTRKCSVCGYKDTVTDKGSKIIVPEMVFVEGGTVVGAKNTNNYEGVFIKDRTVTLSNFYMGKYAVTQEEYASVMEGQKVTVKGTEYTLESNPSYCTKDSTEYTLFSGDVQEKRPVEGVTWYDAVWYCNALSEKEGLTKAYNIEVTQVEQASGKTGYYIYTADVSLVENANGYRLPTEAEWEYAARGGDPTAADWNYVFSGADTAEGVSYESEKNAGLDTVGWYCYNSINGTTGDTYPSSGEQGYGTHQVGKKEANRLGLYDMSGNVDEWCYDWPETVNTGEESDPTGASSGSVRVSRGGGWVDSANFKSVAFRGCGNPSTRYNYYGFRVVRTSTEVIENLAHTHKFAEEWTKDETNHWHAAICEHTTEVSEKAEHSFVNEVCTICEYSRIPEGFVLVEGTTITGTESWTPESEVFVSKRKLTIPNLIVSDHEVTRGEYLEVMEIDPSTAKAYNKNGTELTGEDVLNTPVNEVKWYAALVYCNKRSIDEGFTPCYTIKGSTDPDAWGEVPTQSYDIWNAATCDFNANGYRLPTNAEWEWLARGGENYLCAGSDILDEVAWYTDNTNGTREVKTKAPNGYGLYDMNGNVSEWCWDWYRIISDSTPADGVASGTYRVFRGGGWNSDDSCQVTSSGNHYPHYHYDFYGFRVVRTVTD